MDSGSHLADFEERFRIKFQPILENARRHIHKYIEKKGKVDLIGEDNRSVETQDKIEQLDRLMLRVDVYLDEIFGDFIREVAAQQYTMLCNR